MLTYGFSFFVLAMEFFAFLRNVKEENGIGMFEEKKDNDSPSMFVFVLLVFSFFFSFYIYNFGLHFFSFLFVL